jgi:hypothetical protein
VTRGSHLSALTWLVTGVCLAGLGVLAGAALSAKDEDIVLLSALAALAVLSELLDFAPFPHSRVSLSAALIFAAGTVGALPGVAVVASAAVVADYLAHRKPLFKVAFNAGVLLLMGAAYVGVFQAFATGYRPDDWPAILGPAILGSALGFAVNSALVALAIALHNGRHPFPVWSESFRWLLPHYILLGVLAAMMASAYDSWELAGLAILLVPMGMAWLVLKQQADLASQLSQRLRGA